MVVSLGIAVIELRRKKEIVVAKELLLFCSQIEFRKEICNNLHRHCYHNEVIECDTDIDINRKDNMNVVDAPCPMLKKPVIQDTKCQETGLPKDHTRRFKRKRSVQRTNLSRNLINVWCVEAEWNQGVSLGLLLLETDHVLLDLDLAGDGLAVLAALWGHANSSHHGRAEEGGVSITWLIVIKDLAVVKDLWELVWLGASIGGTLDDGLAHGRELVITAVGVLLEHGVVVDQWIHAEDVEHHVADWQELGASVAGVVGVSWSLDVNVRIDLGV